MKLKSILLLSSAIALGLTLTPFQSINAQSVEAPAKNSKNSELGFDLKLNAQQRKAIEAIGGFAFDQMEALITNGLDPKKIDSAEAERKSQDLRQVLSSFRLDNQQKEALRTILRSARQQMKRQIQN